MSSPKSFQEKNISTRALISGLWSHLNKRRKRQLFLLLFIMLSSALAELVSLASVVPFLAILTNPEIVWSNENIQRVLLFMGFNAKQNLLIPITICFCLCIVISAFIRLFNIWLYGRVAALIGSDFSCEVFRRNLYQPYSVHISRNSSELIAASTSQINLTVIALNLALQLISSSLIVIVLIFGFFLINKTAAILSILIFSFSYITLSKTVRKKLENNSSKIEEAVRNQIKSLQEGLGAIRHVLIEGNQKKYIDFYKKTDKPRRILRANSEFLGTFPRFSIEAIGLIGMALLALLLIFQSESNKFVLPLMGTIALGIQKLLPAMQNIYGGWAGIRSYSSAIIAVINMLDQPLDITIFNKAKKPLNLKNEIFFDSVSFKYSNDKNFAIDNLSFKINRGDRIGIIGSTGSGKSTTADLLMGLLEPTRGNIYIDGMNLNDKSIPERVLQWRMSIAHVPQNIFLSDGTIAENIAFGIPSEEINMSKVIQVAKKSQLHDYIKNSREGYQSFVGERGIRLSGGQRQRIGIARALYKNCKFLLLDEATSALDTTTEDNIMKTIYDLKQDMTIVMISHRKNTLKGCNKIINLGDKKKR